MTISSNTLYKYYHSRRCAGGGFDGGSRRIPGRRGVLAGAGRSRGDCDDGRLLRRRRRSDAGGLPNPLQTIRIQLVALVVVAVESNGVKLVGEAGFWPREVGGVGGEEGGPFL